MALLCAERTPKDVGQDPEMDCGWEPWDRGWGSTVCLGWICSEFVLSSSEVEVDGKGLSPVGEGRGWGVVTQRSVRCRRGMFRGKNHHGPFDWIGHFGWGL